MGKATICNSKPRVKKDSQIINRNKMRRKGGNGKNGNGSLTKKKAVIELCLAKFKDGKGKVNIETDYVSIHHIKETKGGKDPKKVITDPKHLTQHSRPDDVGDSICSFLKNQRFSDEEITPILQHLTSQHRKLTTELSSERRKTKQGFFFIQGTKVSSLQKIKQGEFKVIK